MFTFQCKYVGGLQWNLLNYCMGKKEREGAGEADLRPWVDEGMIQW